MNSDDSLERPSSDLSEYILFQILKIFFCINKNQFFKWKIEYFRFFFAVFFKILPEFNDFVNSDACIGKIASKSIRLQTVFINNFLSQVNKKQILSIEKMSIYYCAYSFFGEVFNPMRYTGVSTLKVHRRQGACFFFCLQAFECG